METTANRMDTARLPESSEAQKQSPVTQLTQYTTARVKQIVAANDNEKTNNVLTFNAMQEANKLGIPALTQLLKTSREVEAILELQQAA